LLITVAIFVQLALSVPIARRFWRLAPRGTSFVGFWFKMHLAASGWWVKPDEWPEMWQAQRWNVALVILVVLTMLIGTLIAGLF
jgi:hypothetical protein